ncbi:MAG TPA: nucleotidyltransferase [Candidatus Acetothermia bacterium]|nr:nucleotidyltransferase [Candidatus Acetothermia bacterium]
MKSLEEIKRILARHRHVLEERYGVEEIAIFGSLARGEGGPASDIDLVVSLNRPLGFKFFELWDYLESILGMEVDLLTPNALKRKPRLWERIKGDLIYV